MSLTSYRAAPPRVIRPVYFCSRASCLETIGAAGHLWLTAPKGMDIV